MDGPDYGPHRARSPGGAARRGAAPGLRRAHPCAAPGGRSGGRAATPAAAHRSAASPSRASRTGPFRSAPTARSRTRRRSAGFEALAAGAPGCISVELAQPSRLPATWSEPLGAAPDLAAARFDRPLDRGLAADLLLGHHRGRARRTRWEASRRRSSSSTTRPRSASGTSRPTTRSACARSPRRWPTSRAGPASARSSTTCSRPPTSRPRTFPAELAARLAEGAPPAARGGGGSAHHRRSRRRSAPRSGR